MEMDSSYTQLLVYMFYSYMLFLLVAIVLNSANPLAAPANIPYFAKKGKRSRNAIQDEDVVWIVKNIGTK